ncbi:MAG: hypothetical protein V1808_03695 [Candidatus Daviesbacteria bacterium]
MVKVFSILFSFFLFCSTAIITYASQGDIPEKNGDYSDPDHKGIRVRVFVHEPKTVSPITTTCSDQDSSIVVDPAGWKLPSGTWTYNLNTSSVPFSVGSSNLPTIARNGFNQWQNAQGKVAFQIGPSTTKTKSAYDGQNIIAWGRTSGNALAVTYTRYLISTKTVVDVDTIINQKFAWSWTPYVTGVCGKSNTYDAQAVLTHELGHWLGLNDEYSTSYVNHTMYGYGYKGDIKADTLTTGDKAGTIAIYQ